MVGPPVLLPENGAPGICVKLLENIERQRQLRFLIVCDEMLVQLEKSKQSFGSAGLTFRWVASMNSVLFSMPLSTSAALRWDLHKAACPPSTPSSPVSHQS